MTTRRTFPQNSCLPFDSYLHGNNHEAVHVVGFLDLGFGSNFTIGESATIQNFSHNIRGPLPSGNFGTFQPIINPTLASGLMDSGNNFGSGEKTATRDIAQNA